MIEEITRNANIITIETDFYTFGGKALSVTYDLRKQSFTDNGLTFDNCSMSNADSRAIKYFCLNISFTCYNIKYRDVNFLWKSDIS